MDLERDFRFKFDRDESLVKLHSTDTRSINCTDSPFTFGLINTLFGIPKTLNSIHHLITDDWIKEFTGLQLLTKCLYINSSARLNFASDCFQCRDLTEVHRYVHVNRCDIHCYYNDTIQRLPLQLSSARALIRTQTIIISSSATTASTWDCIAGASRFCLCVPLSLSRYPCIYLLWYPRFHLMAGRTNERANEWNFDRSDVMWLSVAPAITWNDICS